MIWLLGIAAILSTGIALIIGLTIGYRWGMEDFEARFHPKRSPWSDALIEGKS